jgi:hypothetical protein
VVAHDDVVHENEIERSRLVLIRPLSHPFMRPFLAPSRTSRRGDPSGVFPFCRRRSDALRPGPSPPHGHASQASVRSRAACFLPVPDASIRKGRIIRKERAHAPSRASRSRMTIPLVIMIAAPMTVQITGMSPQSSQPSPVAQTSAV